MVKFVHLADAHLGGWRERRLSEMNFKAFERAFEVAISEKVDFIVISGDLFDVPLPKMEIIDSVAEVLMKAKRHSVDVYVIGGSHDFSLNKNSLLNTFDTVEALELVDKRPKLVDGFLITGISGKMNSLDRFDFDRLELPSFNTGIFLFHINVSDVTNIDYGGISLDKLPRGFKYYAGGHIHKEIVYKVNDSYIVYPGPLFPNNFKELKEMNGGFFVVNIHGGNVDLEFFENKINKRVIDIDCTGMLPSEVRCKLMDCAEGGADVVLIELKGEVDWRVTEIGLSEIIDMFYENGSEVVLKNTRGLRLKEREIVDVLEGDDVEEFVKREIERLEIYEDKESDVKLIRRLLSENLEKGEDEKSIEYGERVVKVLESIFENES